LRSSPNRDRIGRPGTAGGSWGVADYGGICGNGYRRGLEGIAVPMVADPGSDRLNLRLHVEQAQALREQVAELAEAVAQVEMDVARVHEGIAERGGSLA